MESESRIALIGIIISEQSVESIELINSYLHEARSYIIGRMGIPHVQSHSNLISIALNAPEEIVNALCGKIGRCTGVSAKVIYGKKS